MGEREMFEGYAAKDLVGPKRKCTTLGWSACGRKLASGSVDQNVRVWTVDPSAQQSRPERADVELKGHTGSISHVLWRPGNSADLLVSTTSGEKSDKSTRLWDVRTNRCAATTPIGGLYLTWCPDGSSYAVINQDNVLSWIDMRKAGKVVKTHKFPPNPIFECLWGPAPSQLMLATYNGSLDVVSLPNMELVWSLKGHTAACYCFAGNKGGKYVVTGGADAVINLWELDGLCCTRTWAHMDHPVRALSLSHDSSFVAYATEQGEAEILSTSTGERLVALKIRSQFSDAVAWNPRSNVLAYCDEATDPSTRDRSMVGVVSVYAPSA